MPVDPAVQAVLQQVGQTNQAGDTYYQNERRGADLDARALAQAVGMLQYDDALRRGEEAKARDKIAERLIRYLDPTFDTQPAVPGVQPAATPGGAEGIPNTPGAPTQPASGTPSTPMPDAPPGDMPQGGPTPGPTTVGMGPRAGGGPGGGGGAAVLSQVTGMDMQRPAAPRPAAQPNANPYRLPGGAYQEMLRDVGGRGPGAGQVLNRLEGDRQNATKFDEATRKRSDEHLVNMWNAIATGQVQAAMYYAKTLGFQLNPQDLQDARTVQFAKTANEMRKLYGDDYDQYGRALVAATQNGGDWQKATTQVPPRKKPLDAIQGQNVLDENGNYVNIGRGGVAKPVTVKGADGAPTPLKGTPKAGGRSRVAQLPGGQGYGYYNETTQRFATYEDDDGNEQYVTAPAPRAAGAQAGKPFQSADGNLWTMQPDGTAKPVTAGSGDGAQLTGPPKAGAAGGRQPARKVAQLQDGTWAWVDNSGQPLRDEQQNVLKAPTPSSATPKGGAGGAGGKPQFRQLADGTWIYIDPAQPTQGTSLTIDGGGAQPTKPMAQVRPWPGNDGKLYVTGADGQATPVTGPDGQHISQDPKNPAPQVRQTADGRFVVIDPRAPGEAQPVTTAGGGQLPAKPAPGAARADQRAKKDQLVDGMVAEGFLSQAEGMQVKAGGPWPKKGAGAAGGKPGQTQQWADRIFQSMWPDYFVIDPVSTKPVLRKGMEAQAIQLKRDIIRRIEAGEPLDTILGGAGVPTPEAKPGTGDLQGRGTPAPFQGGTPGMWLKPDGSEDPFGVYQRR